MLLLGLFPNKYAFVQSYVILVIIHMYIGTYMFVYTFMDLLSDTYLLTSKHIKAKWMIKFLHIMMLRIFIYFQAHTLWCC